MEFKPNSSVKFSILKTTPILNPMEVTYLYWYLTICIFLGSQGLARVANFEPVLSQFWCNNKQSALGSLWWENTSSKTRSRYSCTPATKVMYDGILMEIPNKHGCDGLKQNWNWACCPFSHYSDYYTGPLSFSQVTATHLKIRYPSMNSSTGTRSSSELQWLDKDERVPAQRE